MNRDRATAEWQVDASRIPSEGWDAVVVGGGPAGCMAALGLGRAGRRVLLLERFAYPRDKACGDLLIADALGALRRVGLYDRVAAEAGSVPEARISSPRRIEWSIPGEYMVLPRARLDTILAQGAADAGATVALGRVEGVHPAGSGVEVRVRGRDEAFHARHVILAAGADVSLLQDLGMLERAAPTAVALRAYVRSPVRLGHLFISFDREIVPGYAWAFPLGDGAYNVGVGALHDPTDPAHHDLRALFETFSREVPAVRDLMAAADWQSPIRGARLRCGLEGARPRGPGNILAAGEQIGTTYPFTGEGIGKAMETGEMAAEAVVQALARDDPAALDAYGERVEEELKPRYQGYEVAQRWFSRPWLNDLVSWRMRRGGFLADAARGMVAETVDPATFCSWRGLLRSVVS